MEGDYTWHAKVPNATSWPRRSPNSTPGSPRWRDRERGHDTAHDHSAARRAATGRPARSLGQHAGRAGADYPDLVVLDGDLANSTRADIFAAAVPDRFFEMGIAEQNMLGVAAGMATCGFVPWISTFAAFLANRALDQIRVVVAQPHLNVKMCGSYSGILTGKTGKTHQSVEDLAIFRAMPVSRRSRRPMRTSCARRCAR